MRVGMIGPGLDVPGGMTQVHRTWLRAHALRGVRVDYIPTMGEGSRLQKLAKNVVCEARFACMLAQGYRPDLFHVHVADGPSFWRKLFYIEQARLAGVPTVAHLHGAWMEDFWDRDDRNKWAVRRMFRSVDLVMPLHGRMADRVREWAGDVPVEILYNPVVVSELDPLPERSGQPDHPTVLMLGVVHERKGPFDLAAAIPQVLERVPTARFRFGGNGETDRLRRMVQELGVADSVDVLGWISGQPKLDALRSADVYCLPSYFENLPVSILEGMAAALPVVATTIAGVPEEVLEGQTGFMVEPGDVDALADRLARLLADPDLRARMGAAGRQRVEQHFDNEVVVARLVDLWRRVAGR